MNHSPHQFFLSNLKEINNLNQRWGRMLSLIDLIFRKTISISLSAYLISAIQKKKNFLICAEPGGAGKTTLMGALLAFLPINNQIITLKEEHIKLKETGDSDRPRTYIIHEIGKGSYYGYYWGKSIKKTLKILDSNTNLYTNMHPDTLDSVFQTFQSFGCSKELIKKFSFIIFLDYSYKKKTKRQIREVWESSERGIELIYSKNTNFKESIPILSHFDEDSQKKNEKFLKDCLKNNIFILEDVSRRFNDVE